MDVKKLQGRMCEILKNDPSMHFEDVAEKLQDRFPEYKRIKVSPFTRKVSELMPRDLPVVDTPSTDLPTAPNSSPDVTDLAPTQPRSDAPSSKRRRVAESVIPYLTQIPIERLSSIAGLDAKMKESIEDLVLLPFTQAALCQRLMGASSLTGLLICGAPGVGKTLLARSIAGEVLAADGEYTGGCFSLNATEIVSGVSGEAETNIRSLFDHATSLFRRSVIILDELDAICQGKTMEKRIVTQLQASLDAVAGNADCKVLVIATTSRVDSIEPSLRRSGRFDREVALGMPDAPARRAILEALSRDLPLDPAIDQEDMAKRTAGYVGADLQRLVKEAGLAAVKRIARQPQVDQSMTDYTETITMDDFVQALGKVQPSARREGFTTVPSVTFEDVGSLETLKEALEESVCLPIRRQELFTQLLGASCNSAITGGLLMYGPPGCGKTLLAKAIANRSQASFISVKGPELLNKYVGESERAVRQVFARAQTSSPCVIFFDEIDALCPRRSAENAGPTERVVNQMLTELDGVGGNNAGVFVIAATNRPDMVDAAMLRPGRLGKLLYVPLPDEEGRADILKTLLRKTPVEDAVNVAELARLTLRYSGADLNALVKEAVVSAVKRIDRVVDLENVVIHVTAEDFEIALNKVRASVSETAEKHYLELKRSHEARGRA